MSPKTKKSTAPKNKNLKQKTTNKKIESPILSGSDDLDSSVSEEESVKETPKKRQRCSNTSPESQDPIPKKHSDQSYNGLTAKVEDLTKVADEIVKKISLLSDKIEDLSLSIRTMSEVQLWVEKQILALRKSLMRTEPGVAIDYKHKFPIDDEELFKQFVLDLNDEDYRDVMVNRCRQEGGSNTNKMVRNIWSFLFATCIQKLLSWSGQNEKIKLSDTKLFSLVLDSTLLTFPSTTASIVSDVTKTFFQNVSNRDPTSAKKKAKKRIVLTNETIEALKEQQVEEQQ